MIERSDEEEIRPQGPEPEPAAPEEAAGAIADVDTGAPEPAEPPPPAPPRRGFAGVLAVLALLIALGAAGAAGWLAWTARVEDDGVAANRGAIRAAADGVDELRSALEALGERLDELETADRGQSQRLDELDELGDQVAELREFAEQHESVPDRLGSLESQVASLQGVSTGAREAWLLAETEYYLQLANAELQLAGNAERALLALRFADERIRQLADPALTAVRRALAEELRALEAMETPDLAGMTMTLASLAESVESLPLAGDVERAAPGSVEPPADASGLDRAIASVKSAFSSIVSVRRTDETVEPLLSPEAEYFLRANLMLRLQTARLALLRGEQAIVDQALADAADWLSEYYAADTRAVQSALETLAEIRDADWSVTPPDISDSLRLLREYRQRRQAQGSGAEPPGDEPGQ